MMMTVTKKMMEMRRRRSRKRWKKIRAVHATLTCTTSPNWLKKALEKTNVRERKTNTNYAIN